MVDYLALWEGLAGASSAVAAFTLYRYMKLRTSYRNIVKTTLELDFDSVFYRSVVENMYHGFLMFDAKGSIHDVNDAYCHMTGYTKNEILGRNLEDLESPDTIGQTKRYLEAAKKYGGSNFRSVHLKRSGEPLPVEISASFHELGGEWYFGLVKDHTRQKIAESIDHVRRQLSQVLIDGNKELLLQKALDSIEGLTHSEIGYFHFFGKDENVIKMQIWSSNTLEKECFNERSGSIDILVNAGIWNEGVASRQPVLHNRQHGIRDAAGAGDCTFTLMRYMNIPIIRDDTVVAVLGVGNKASDYTPTDLHTAEKIGHIAYSFYMKQLAQEQIEFLAYYDTLTALPNRTQLTNRMEKVLDVARRFHRIFAVCYLDLDNFRSINERYGNAVGDRIIQVLASRLEEMTRQRDILARFGGDEFVMVLSDIKSVHECEMIVTDILYALALPVEYQKEQFYLSASMGITVYPKDNSDIETLIRHANYAMNQAKGKGKSSYSFYQPSEVEEKKEDEALLGEFVHGLGHDELLFHYQPKISLDSGEVTGFEALIRWNHPKRGLLYPIDFLHMVEETPYEIALSEWVIRKGIEKLAAWQEEGLDLVLSLNVSPRHIEHRSFYNFISSTLREYPQRVARNLELEILEVANISDIEQTSRVIQSCKELGLRFSLDDFGTGYSSLSYFHQLDVDVVKIDQNFVRHILDNAHAIEIIKGIHDIAARLDRPVIAEGVETLELGLILRGLGCRYAQGYGISKPMPESAVKGWLAEWSKGNEWYHLDDHMEHHPQSEINVAVYSYRRWFGQITRSFEGGAPFPELDYKGSQFYHWYTGLGKEKYGTNDPYGFIQNIYYDIFQLAKELKHLEEYEVHGEEEEEEHNRKAQDLFEELRSKGDDLIMWLGKLS